MSKNLQINLFYLQTTWKQKYSTKSINVKPALLTDLFSDHQNSAQNAEMARRASDWALEEDASHKWNVPTSANCQMMTINEDECTPRGGWKHPLMVQPAAYNWSTKYHQNGHRTT